MKYLAFFVAIVTSACEIVRESPSSPTPAPGPTILLQAVSEGYQSPTNYGTSIFNRDEKNLGRSGYRGINVVAVKATDGDLLTPLRYFDTHFSESAWEELGEFVTTLPDGSILMFAVSDEAGVSLGYNSGKCWGEGYTPENTDCCTQRNTLRVNNGLKVLESLGATEIRTSCYRNSWSMISVKGEGKKSETLTRTGRAISTYTFPRR